MKSHTFNGYELQAGITKSESKAVIKAEKNSRIYAITEYTIPTHCQANLAKIKSIENEVVYSSNVNHDKILQTGEIFRHSNKLYIAKEFCKHGNLMQYLSSLPDQILPEEAAIKIIRDIFQAYHYLLENGIVHRNIHAKSVYITEGISGEIVAKLGNFSGAINTNYLENVYMNQKVGKIYTASPEMIKGHSYSYKTDVYSIGALFYLMLFGRYPFNSSKDMAQQQMEGNIIYDLKSRGLSCFTIDFINKCLSHSPDERINIESIFSHPIMEKKYSFLSQKVYPRGSILLFNAHKTNSA
jgi:serine/threonine protein kinase